MKVSFGIHVAPSGPFLRREDTGRFSDLVKMAEDYGAEAIGTYDTAFVGGDAFVRATVIAIASTRARIGLRPTNPITREPQIMASFLASIDSLTGGRAFMDMARGDSAVLNIGYKIATRARIEDYITCVRDLLATGEATYRAARSGCAGHPAQCESAFLSRSAPKVRRCCASVVGSATGS